MLMLLLISCLLKTEPLAVRFQGFQEPKGMLLVALYNQEKDFLDEKAACFKKAYPVRSKDPIAVDIEMPEGEYALSCFHDVNNNGRLDKNLFGVPTEPYGFSNNARPKFRAPNWSETVFLHQEKSKPLTITLKSW